MYAGTQRPELIGTEGRRCFLMAIPRQIDVFPAKRGQMSEIARFGAVPLLSKVIDSSLQVRRIP
jgi:hypothetical protein